MWVNRQGKRRFWPLWLMLLVLIALTAGMIAFRGQPVSSLIRLGTNEPTQSQGVRPVEPNSSPRTVAQTAVSETGTPGSNNSNPAETEVVLEPAEAEVVEAFDCARAKHQLPAYVRDPELDAEANKILAQLLKDPTAAGESEGHYSLFAHLTIDLAAPKSGCSAGDFDVTRVGKADLEKSQHIGVAAEETTLYDQSLLAVVVIGR